MAATRRRTLAPRKTAATAAPVAAPVAEPPRPVAVIDIGASAIRLLVAEAAEGRDVLVLEDLSRGVLLGKDTFTNGRLGAASIEATLKSLEGFRRVIEGYGVVHYRAVATSAVREALNRDTFLDRVRLRTGIDVEVIDGSEENRLTYVAVRECLRGHEALTSADALLVEVGGGSADISYLHNGEPIRSGTYPLGSIRMRQSLHSWRGTHEQRMRCSSATSTTSSPTSAARTSCKTPSTSSRSAATCASPPRSCSAPSCPRPAFARSRATSCSRSAIGSRTTRSTSWWNATSCRCRQPRRSRPR
jgi:hypothetical protein